MQSISKQKGASMPLTLLFIGMTAVILTIAFKLYPVFYEHWQITSVVESFEEDLNLKDMTEGEIRSNFGKRLVTNSVRGFNISDNVYIEATDESVYISVDYEVRLNMYRNIDAVVKFEEIFEKKF